MTTDLDVRTAFAADASGLYLVPDAVARPTTAEEVAELLREASASRTAVTPAGAQTSYVGGSIADRGTVLSLRAMDRVLDLDPVAGIVRVEPGAYLGDVKRAAAGQGMLLAPDPTSEEESTIGGAIACNSSGARSLKYGATRPHVRALTVALADGRLIDVRRPALEKNTAGFPLVQDPVDWFVGSEGTLGVVVAAELQLLPLPNAVTGLGLPFRTAADALAFIVAARAARDRGEGVSPRCLEYLDAKAFAIARASIGGTWAADADAYVYVEQESFASDTVDLDAWLALAEAHAALTDEIQVFEGEASLRDARKMRHAVPATLNERAARYRAAGGRKVSTDWAVPYPLLHRALLDADAIAATFGITPVGTFGHAGNGHPHQHFVGRDPHELETIERAVEATLRHVVSLGGTVSAEHGIGKVKRQWLALQLTDVQRGVMRAIKNELDPLGILSPGNVFADDREESNR
jgi:FAD/FMN-containing dehydrogenase